MSQRKKPSVGGATRGLADGVDDLFSALNLALNDMLSKLEDGGTATVERNHSFQTRKGPAQAHAGLHVRMGGLTAGQTASQPSDPQPLNRGMDDKTTSPTQTAPIRTAYCDLFDDDEFWIITADLPGVSKKDIELHAEGQVLHVTTHGARKYRAQVDLGFKVRIPDDCLRLRNGIMTVKLPKDAL